MTRYDFLDQMDEFKQCSNQFNMPILQNSCLTDGLFHLSDTRLVR